MFILHLIQTPPYIALEARVQCRGTHRPQPHPSGVPSPSHHTSSDHHSRCIPGFGRSASTRGRRSDAHTMTRITSAASVTRGTHRAAEWWERRVV